MIKLEATQRTDIGHSRQTNQDRLFAKIEDVSGVSCGLFCIADGMGGLDDGHYAATVTIEAIEHWWSESLKPLIESGAVESNHIFDEFQELFSSMNEYILQQAKAKNTKHGTTCSLLFIYDDLYFIAHSGDSRIYLYATAKTFIKRLLLRRNKMRQLTKDQTWGNDQLQLGVLSADEIDVHPKKNKLTGCLGVFERPRISVSSGVLKGNGAFILCSDGVYQIINDKELAKIASQNKQSNKLADTLIDTALAHGTTDNASVVAVVFNDDGKKASHLINKTTMLSHLSDTEP